MRSFRKYLAESEKNYSFRIKLAHKCDDDTMDMLESALERYELVSLSKPKKTPIQEHPMDFQTLTNAEVYIMDAEVKYPVTAYQLYEYLQDAANISPSDMVVINRAHPEEIAREEAAKQEDREYSPLLDDESYEGEESEIKGEELYGDKYNENFLKSLETHKYEFATDTKEKSK